MVLQEAQETAEQGGPLNKRVARQVRSAEDDVRAAASADLAAAELILVTLKANSPGALEQPPNDAFEIWPIVRRWQVHFENAGV